jgi:hypothetical protein
LFLELDHRETQILEEPEDCKECATLVSWFPEVSLESDPMDVPSSGAGGGHLFLNLGFKFSLWMEHMVWMMTVNSPFLPDWQCVIYSYRLTPLKVKQI